MNSPENSTGHGEDEEIDAVEGDHEENGEDTHGFGFFDSWFEELIGGVGKDALKQGYEDDDGMALEQAFSRSGDEVNYGEEADRDTPAAQGVEGDNGEDDAIEEVADDS